MSKRVPGSMRTRQSLSDLVEGRLSTPDGRAEMVKLASRLIIEEALEAEQRDALGRDYYEHGAALGQGYRNGTRTGRLKTAEGFVEYTAPQTAGREEPFRSEIRDHLKGRTRALEDLAVELLARGLSVRDIEDAFQDETGRLLLSRTAVSEIGERLWADYQEFAGRDLSEYDIVYLFVDGIAERIRPGQKREPVLAAWGFTASGAKVPEDMWPDFKVRATAAYQAPSRAIARELADGLARDYETELPSAVACFQDDFEACIAHLRLPVTHRRATRTTNLLERLFVEERRRLKIIPNAFGEKPVLKLMFGAMIRAAERWRAIKVTDFERRQMAAIREELDQEYEVGNDLDNITGNARHSDKLSSNSRT